MLPSSRLDPVEPDRLPMIRSARSAIKPVASIITRTLMALTASTLTVVLAGPRQEAHAVVVFTIKQLGDFKLEVTASGSLDTTDLTLQETLDAPNFSLINAGQSALLVGVSPVDQSLNPNSYKVWTSNNPLLFTPTGPFGTAGSTFNGFFNPDNPGTSIIGIDPFFDTIYTPSNCGVNSTCSITESTTIFDPGQSLGLSSGTYTWAWGSGADQVMQLDVLPVPGPLPLFGAGAAFAWSRRLRQRVRSSQG